METTTDKIVYFVVAVDLSTKTKYIDDETLTAVFPNGSVFDTEQNEWGDESQKEYAQALAILNNSEWETE
jgi:hypothetical protein